MIVRRAEKHVIKSNSAWFDLFISFCHASKNLYNHANYIVRQEFINNNKWIRYIELDQMLKADKEYPDYANMPMAQSAQQTLKLLDKNWKSFFKAIKDWKKHPEKYLGRPNLPKYLKKDANFVLMLTNQNCFIGEDNLIHFPKCFEGFTIQPQFISKENFVSFQQVRFIPHKHRIVVELVYNINVVDTDTITDNNRYIGIDIGVDNLATVSNNVNLPAFIINGKPLKSINQLYNKQIAHYQSICTQMNDKYNTNRTRRITDKRTARINNYLHKASKKIIDFCKNNNINTIVIGKNDEWKQEINLGHKTNQSFVQIPFARFIEMIQYKAENNSIAVILTEESYTSGTSFIDNELPTKEYYNKKRRIKRGMFKSNNGTLINADLNASYQIIKKVFPIKWDSGCALHPIVVDLK